MMENEFYIFVASAWITFSNLGIAVLVRWMHEKAETGIWKGLSSFQIAIKVLAGGLEIILYTVLLILKQPTFLVGWFVIKTLAGYKVDNEKPAKHGSGVAIFRIGNILALSVAAVAYLIFHPSVNL